MTDKREIIEEGVLYIKNRGLGWNEPACKHVVEDTIPHTIAMYDSGGGHEVCLECLLEELKKLGVVTLMSGVIKRLEL